MADTYGTCPFSAFDDERLDGDPGPARAAFALILLVADDWGLFEGDLTALSRRVGCDPAWLDLQLVELERRRVIERYDAPGRRRQVGAVIGFHAIDGHVTRKAYESQRCASLYPDREGNIIPGRSGRKSPNDGQASDPQEPAKKRASKVQASRKSGASKVQASGKSRASEMQDRREERRGEEISSLRSEHTAPQAVCAPEPAAPTGAQRGDPTALGAPGPRNGTGGSAPPPASPPGYEPDLPPGEEWPEANPPPEVLARWQGAVDGPKRPDFPDTRSYEAARIAWSMPMPRKRPRDQPGATP